MSESPAAEERGPSHPRMRDLPGPRRTGGGLGPLFQRAFAWPYRFLLFGLYRAGIRAWQLTLASLAANIVIGWLLVAGRRFVPGALLIVAGLLDIFDGSIARLRGEASRAGAFLDSVMDRISDVILFGCLFWSEAGQGDRRAAGLALSALLVTLLTSHLRAEAEAAGLSMNEGLLQRLERYVMLIIALMVPGGLAPGLGVILILGGLTVLQRGASAWRQLGRPPSPPASARTTNKSDKS